MGDFEIDDLGIIFTRHVNSEKSNEYWIECYRQIRRVYPLNMVIIIDDNSVQELIKIPVDLCLFNCMIIRSDFPKRGEILAYYYYHKYRFFKKAIIIHDSTFLNDRPLPIPEHIVFLWNFEHDFDNPVEEKRLIRCLNNANEVLEMYEKSKMWRGCFGVQSIISLEFLERLVEKYNLFVLLGKINGRNERYHIERIFGVLCYTELYAMAQEKKGLLCLSELQLMPSLYGDIFKWGWGYLYEYYLDEKPKGGLSHRPIVKVWSGR